MVIVALNGVVVIVVSVVACLDGYPILMFAGGGAGFQKQSKPPWENTNANTNTIETTPSW